MKEAISMEGLHVEKDQLGEMTLNYFHKVLTPEFTAELIKVFGNNSKYLIKEFIFGVDCLIEIINTPGTPMKRLLNNSDVDGKLVFVLQNRARIERKPEFYGCQVTQATYDVIEEFFDRGYLPILYYVLCRVRPFLAFKVDGAEFVLSISRDFCNSTSHGVVYFKSLDDPEKRISIPFRNKRLTA